MSSHSLAFELTADAERRQLLCNVAEAALVKLQLHREVDAELEDLIVAIDRACVTMNTQTDGRSEK